MADQDRDRWDAGLIAEGVELISSALSEGSPGPYQLQAAIAALHDEAPSAAETDWPQITALYELLLRVSGNPVVALNHAVAVAMVRGPSAGLDLLQGLAADERITGGHRFHTVRAHLLEMAGDRDAARQAFMEAARRTTSLPHQRYLHAQATRLGADG
jgi:predicted RNA polymerase sigma factor